MGSIKNSIKKVRLPVAIFVVLCGIAVVVGSFLIWIGASGKYPMLGMDHTSISQMLVYNFVGNAPYFKSVGFVMLILGILMVVGAIFGVRFLSAIASLLALAAGGMWIGLVDHHFVTPYFPNAHYANPLNLPWYDLWTGAWLVMIGAFVGLILSLFLRNPTREDEAFLLGKFNSSK